MIIVSQDKKIITNFDNTIGLQINEHILNSDGKRDFEIRAITEKRDCAIAFYATEERAKEVLQEIITCFSFTELTGEPEKLKLIFEITKLGRYQMPER